jgi:uncharacterized membrane protein
VATARAKRHPIPVLHQMRSRPRLGIAASVAIIFGVLFPARMVTYPVTRWLIAWNIGTLLYVAMAAVMMSRSSESQMRRRALQQDDGQIAILTLVALSAIASLAAIAGELAVVKDIHGPIKAGHVTLTGLTVLSSWAFIQITFALHYAHEYYAPESRGRAAGLRFPDCENPTYGDFFYFAAIIGTSGQTADVDFVNKPMRRIGTLHCILAYLFNTIVLALLINIGASMF